MSEATYERVSLSKYILTCKCAVQDRSPHGDIFLSINLFYNQHDSVLFKAKQTQELFGQIGTFTIGPPLNLSSYKPKVIQI